MSVVVITGASRGIGLAATSFLLDAFKATVIAISRTRSPELDALASAHPDTLQIIQCDITDEVAFTKAIQSVPVKYGHLDALVLNAATLDPMMRIASADASLDAWRTHFEINVFSVITGLKAAVPSLRESPSGGKVIFVSSGAAVSDTVGWAPYNASKAAMNALNRTLAAEEREKIVSIAVRPGKVDTAMQTGIRESGGIHMAPDVHESFVQEKKEGLLLKPEDPGHVIAALALNGPQSLSGEFVSWNDERWIPKSVRRIGTGKKFAGVPLSIAFMTMTTTDRIDIHHHFFPPSLSRTKATQSRAVGFHTPPENLPWSADVSLRAMDSLGIQLAILSIPAGIAETFEEAKSANAMMHETVLQHENRFAFWGCLGDWRDVDGALQLISYVFDELGAVGIAVSSSYGAGGEARHIGDDLFDPIWSALDARRAIIFIHGTQTPSSTPIPHPTLGLPITEVPHETFKAAAQLVVNGKTRKFSRLEFILAHMGGSTLALATRVAGLARYMGAPLSEDEILTEFRRYWWDSALSGASVTSPCGAEAWGWGVGDRILWGSDFPAVALDTVRWFDSHFEKTCQANVLQLENVRRNNSLRLFKSRGIGLFTGQASQVPS